MWTYIYIPKLFICKQCWRNRRESVIFLHLFSSRKASDPPTPPPLDHWWYKKPRGLGLIEMLWFYLVTDNTHLYSRITDCELDMASHYFTDAKDEHTSIHKPYKMNFVFITHTSPFLHISGTMLWHNVVHRINTQDRFTFPLCTDNELAKKIFLCCYWK